MTNDMQRFLLAGTAAVLLMVPGTVLACGPAPSCWMQSSAEYLRSVCQGYAKDHQTLKQIATYVEEPEKVPAFGRACKRFRINLRPE
jgi:hypothetical protein